MRIKKIFKVLLFLLILCGSFGMSKNGVSEFYPKGKSASAVPILRGRKECERLARQRLTEDIKYRRKDEPLLPYLKQAYLSGPIPCFNAYGDTAAYYFDIKYKDKFIGYMDVRTFGDTAFAVGEICTIRFSNPLNIHSHSFSPANPQKIKRCIEKLEKMGYRKDRLKFLHFYYFAGITGGVKRGSDVLAGFRYMEGGRVILIDPVSLAILPDSITLLDLQRELEKKFPEAEKKALQKKKEWEELLKKERMKKKGEGKGINNESEESGDGSQLNMLPDERVIEASEDYYDVDFSSEVEPFTYDWLHTACVGGACAIIMYYWSQQGYQKKTIPQVYAEDFKDEWGTDGSLSESRMPDDIIKAFKDVAEKHKKDDIEFDAKGFYDINNYYQELLQKHPVDLNFLDNPQGKTYCNRHACVGVGLVGPRNSPRFILYNGWDRSIHRAYYFNNCNYIAVSTWPVKPIHKKLTTVPADSEWGVIAKPRIRIAYPAGVDTASVKFWIRGGRFSYKTYWEINSNSGVIGGGGNGLRGKILVIQAEGIVPYGVYKIHTMWTKGTHIYYYDFSFEVNRVLYLTAVNSIVKFAERSGSWSIVKTIYCPSAGVLYGITSGANGNIYVGNNKGSGSSIIPSIIEIDGMSGNVVKEFSIPVPFSIPADRNRISDKGMISIKDFINKVLFKGYDGLINVCIA